MTTIASPAPAGAWTRRETSASGRVFETTYFTVLAWLTVERRFHEDFLMFPSERPLEFAREANGHF